MSDPSVYADNDLTEVKQLSMFAAIGSLSYVFWLVGGMEMIERLAYYGVKASAGLYAKTAASEGG
ncbi:MAG: peptide MFS transporter, partial [Gammaproteobacteria bacterium]|nr:peptide MFS transporter [Gammaproteobacteria bacterium]